MTTRSLASTGRVPAAEVRLDDLLELQQDVEALVERDLAYMQREVRLASSLHTFYGVSRPTVPGDLMSRAVQRFSDIIRFPSV